MTCQPSLCPCPSNTPQAQHPPPKHRKPQPKPHRLIPNSTEELKGNPA